MQVLGLLIVAPLWGLLSPKLFVKSWIGFLGVLACCIGLKRGKVTLRSFAYHLLNNITEMVFGAALLVTGFYLLYFFMPFGRTGSEVLVYWIFSTVQLFFVIPTLSARIETIWAQTNAPAPARLPLEDQEVCRCDPEQSQETCPERCDKAKAGNP